MQNLTGRSRSCYCKTKTT